MDFRLSFPNYSKNAGCLRIINYDILFCPVFMYGEHYPGRYANGSIAWGPYLEEDFSNDNPFKSLITLMNVYYHLNFPSQILH